VADPLIRLSETAAIAKYYGQEIVVSTFSEGCFENPIEGLENTGLGVTDFTGQPTEFQQEVMRIAAEIQEVNPD
jgi:hypothetical protein